MPFLLRRSRKQKKKIIYLLSVAVEPNAMLDTCNKHAVLFMAYFFALQLYLFLSVVESVWAKGKQTAYASQTTLGFFFYPVHHEFMLYVCLIGSHL